MSELTHDSDTDEAKVARHADAMRELFGRMLQVAAGGDGIGKVGELLCRAHETYRDLADIEISHEAGQAVADALQPDLGRGEGARHWSFGANRPQIVQMALRVAAHERLGNITPRRNAEKGLFDAIKPMLDL